MESFNQVLEYDRLACTNNISIFFSTVHQNSNFQKAPARQNMGSYSKQIHKAQTQTVLWSPDKLLRLCLPSKQPWEGRTKVDGRLHFDILPSNGSLYPAHHWTLSLFSESFSLKQNWSPVLLCLVGELGSTSHYLRADRQLNTQRSFGWASVRHICNLNPWFLKEGFNRETLWKCKVFKDPSSLCMCKPYCASQKINPWHVCRDKLVGSIGLEKKACRLVLIKCLFS